MCATCFTGCGQSSKAKANTKEVKEEKKENTEDSEKSEAVDLTKMGADMVYATVYQMMVDPDSYEGKKVTMEGTYSPFTDENNGNTYHYCVIKDALGCCSQGMEFLWDGEFPKEGTLIKVTGVYETYKEEGSDDLYCRLKDATMEAVE
ncbi:MAG: hypothetical protein K6A30_03985 [Lachnospiraceae bacterium]|nr:hypothetical protein [Lachnospiraceae bacterium]